VYVVRTEASMQLSIDIEALDTLQERTRSAARLDGHLDADEMVVGVLTAFAPLPIVDNAGGVS
jgi:hypothetical protein